MKKNLIKCSIYSFLVIGVSCICLVGCTNKTNNSQKTTTTTSIKTTATTTNATNSYKGLVVQFNNFTCLTDANDKYKYLSYVDGRSISFDLNYLLSKIDNSNYTIEDAILKIDSLDNTNYLGTIKNEEWVGKEPDSKYLDNRLYVYYITKTDSPSKGTNHYEYIFLDSLTGSVLELYDYTKSDEECKIAKWDNKDIQNFINKYIKLYNSGDLKNVARLDAIKIKDMNNKIYIDDNTYLFLDSTKPTVWQPNSTYKDYKSTTINSTGDEIKYIKTQTKFSTGYKFVNPESGEEIWMIGSNKNIDLTDEQINIFVNEYYTYDYTFELQ